jgi:endonuclease G
MKKLNPLVAVFFIFGTGVQATGCRFLSSQSKEVKIDPEGPARTIDRLREIVKNPVGGPEGFRMEIDNDSAIVSFNCKFGHANWASWTLTAADLGTAARTKKFHAERKLPKENCLSPLSENYTDSGFDRGHLVPSGDRTRDREYNQGVFTMANIVPQAKQVNGLGWNSLERFTQESVKKGSDAIVVAGTFGSIGKFSVSGINIPEYTWKVVLLVPKGESYSLKRTTRIYAILYKNALDLAPVELREALLSVDELEAKVGIDVFSGIEDKIEEQLEKRIDPLF